jgi:hypothetical protein
MAKDATKKQYLDYDGLGLFWGKIKDNFARKSEALKTLSVAVDETDKNKVVIAGTYADGITTFTSDAFPTASSTQAGLMTKEQATTLAGLVATGGQENIINGIQLEGNTVSVVGDAKLANIGLKYESVESEDGKSQKAYIALVDLNGGENPTAISKIDVTELVKTGLLADTSVIVKTDKDGNPGTFLKLDFHIVDEAGVSSIQSQYIDVSDLVDIYTPGEGINIDGKKISVVKADVNTFGGIKTGYTGDAAKTYAVKVDDSGNAYVTVNWSEYTVDVNSNSTDYLVVTPSADSTTYTISAGKGLTDAIANANSAVQTITVLGKTLSNGGELTVEDASAESALNLKAAAHKDITTAIGTGSDDLVATSSAVKSYVDGEIEKVNGSITDITKDTTGIIDVRVTAGKEAAIAAAKEYTNEEIAKFIPLESADIDEICKFE